MDRYLIQTGARTAEAASPEAAVAAAARLVYATPDTQWRILRELREKGAAAYTYGFTEVEITRVSSAAADLVMDSAACRGGEWGDL